MGMVTALKAVETRMKGKKEQSGVAKVASGPGDVTWALRQEAKRQVTQLCGVPMRRSSSSITIEARRAAARCAAGRAGSGHAAEEAGSIVERVRSEEPFCNGN